MSERQRYPYIGALSIHQSIALVKHRSIALVKNQRMVYPYIRSEDGPYIGAPMFEHEFQYMAMFIRSPKSTILKYTFFQECDRSTETKKSVFTFPVILHFLFFWNALNSP